MIKKCPIFSSSLFFFMSFASMAMDEFDDNLFLESRKSLLNWVKDLPPPSLPLGGTWLVPQSAPMIAVVVANNPEGDHKENYSINTVLNICRAGIRSGRSAFIILPNKNNVSKYYFNAIDNDETLSPEAKIRCKSSLIFPKNGGYSDAEKIFYWQQDHFFSIYDDIAGKIHLKAIANYDSELNKKYLQNVFSDLRKILQSNPLLPLLNFSSPIKIPTFLSGKAIPSYFGGNSMALPNGVYVTGTDQDSPQIYHHFKGNNKHILKLHVNPERGGVWHVDNLISLLQTRPQENGPTKLVVAMPSVGKALQLLETNPYESFCYSDDNSYFNGFVDVVANIIRFNDISGLPPDELATFYFDMQRVLAVDLEYPNFENRKATIEKFNEFVKKAKEAMKSITNYKVLHQALFSHHLLLPMKALNDQNQQIFEQNQKLVREWGILNGYNVDIIEVPVLFFPIGSGRLSNKKTLLPNPVNLLLIDENTVEIPKTYNKAFDDYILEAFSQRNIKVGFADTRSLHVRGGGLHCATHTINISGKPPTR